jgi:hypothetical protein
LHKNISSNKISTPTFLLIIPQINSLKYKALRTIVVSTNGVTLKISRAKGVIAKVILPKVMALAATHLLLLFDRKRVIRRLEKRGQKEKLEIVEIIF